ncbi:MAG: hypothetical protein U0Z26_12320 [Anaerolineales bacterium]
MEFPNIRRIGKWIVLVGAYLFVTSSCVGLILLPIQNSFGGGYGYQSGFSFGRMVSGLLNIAACVVPLVIVGGMMAGMVWIFKRDQKREEEASDDFKHENLFYRYGYEINHRTLSIATRVEWTDAQIQEFAAEMGERIATKIREHFAGANVEVINPVHIKDRDLTSDARDFLKIIFHSIRGSQVTHFIYHSVLGKYIVVHYITRVRGKYRWHDVVDFVITGPLTIWFWFANWMQNQYSVVAAISKFIGNSYDLIDLASYFESSYLVLMDETGIFLKEKGLLTEVLNNIIVQNINNSQNINVNNSSNVNLTGITNAVAGVAKRFIP